MEILLEFIILFLKVFSIGYSIMLALIIGSISTSKLGTEVTYKFDIRAICILGFYIVSLYSWFI